MNAYLSLSETLSTYHTLVSSFYQSPKNLKVTQTQEMFKGQTIQLLANILIVNVMCKNQTVFKP